METKVKFKNLEAAEVCKILENKKIKVLHITTTPNTFCEYTVFYKEK